MEFIRTTGEDGQLIIKFGNATVGAGHAHHLPPVVAGTELESTVLWVDSAYTQMGQAMDSLHSIETDERLSAFGKQERNVVFKVDLIENASKLEAALDDYQATVDGDEASLYKLPEISPGNLYASTRAVEVRQWWRSLPVSGSRLSDVLSRGSDEVIAALLDSPVALVDGDLIALRRAWQEKRQQADPDRWAWIEKRRAGLERARRAARLIGASTLSALRMKQADAVPILAKSTNLHAQRGGAVFGLGHEDVARYQKLMAQRKAGA